MREVLRTPSLEWCGIMRASSSNILMGEMIKVIKNLEPNMIHECPYTNAIIVNKIMDVSKMPSIFSNGRYKTIINVANKKDENIFEVEAIVDWVSSEKNSYG